jgi:hypothetical protein
MMVAPENVMSVRAASATRVDGHSIGLSTRVVGPWRRSKKPLFMSIGPASMLTKTEVTKVFG